MNSCGAIELPPGDAPLRLLTRLEAAAGEAVGAEELMAALGVDRDGLRVALDGLRELGYVIAREHPHGTLAYSLQEIPDLLIEHELTRRLGTTRIGRGIEVVRTCGSTNDLARARAQAGADSGFVVLAEEQTAGRGRRGRTWHSTPGLGLYLSLVYRPDAPLLSVALLQVTTGVAVAHAAMRLTGHEVRLRWPNDVLAGGRKLSGLLVETVAVPGRAEPAYIVGVGLNVGQTPDDFPEEIRDEATSLTMIAGRPLLRADVFATLCATLEDWYGRMEAGDVAAVADSWRPLSSLLRRRVRLQRGDRWLFGEVVDLDPVRGVRLQTDDGEASWIPAEHVLFIRPEDVTGE